MYKVHIYMCVLCTSIYYQEQVFACLCLYFMRFTYTLLLFACSLVQAAVLHIYGYMSTFMGSLVLLPTFI